MIWLKYNIIIIILFFEFNEKKDIEADVSGVIEIWAYT